MKFFKKAATPENEDWYEYDDIPQTLRQQIYYLMERTFGDIGDGELNHYWLDRDPYYKMRWNHLERSLLEYYGIPTLADGFDSLERVKNFLLSSGVHDFLKVVVAFVGMVREITYHPGCVISSDSHYLQKVQFEYAYNGVHKIFTIHRIGYKIIENAEAEWGFQAVRIDSEYLHEETVKKAVTLLHTMSFPGPLKEFEKALEYNTKGDYENAILWANRAFESTIKAILGELSIPFDANKDRASVLIDKLTDAILLPSLADLLPIMRENLKGLPKLRNKLGGHGWGITPRGGQQNYAQFALHLSGSFIVFIIEMYKESSGKLP